MEIGPQSQQTATDLVDTLTCAIFHSTIWVLVSRLLYRTLNFIAIMSPLYFYMIQEIENVYNVKHGQLYHCVCLEERELIVLINDRSSVTMVLRHFCVAT
jgi:hypothetical protein